MRRRQISLVSEDGHRPCLNIELRYESRLTSNTFLRKNDSSKYNFCKVKIYDLYMSLANIDWSPFLDFDDADSASICFYDVLTEVLDKLFHGEVQFQNLLNIQCGLPNP